jgi:hypothetical protein
LHHRNEAAIDLRDDRLGRRPLRFSGYFLNRPAVLERASPYTAGRNLNAVMFLESRGCLGKRLLGSKVCQGALQRP